MTAGAPINPYVTPEMAPMDDLEALDFARLTRQRVLEQISRRVVGQDAVIDLLLTALFANGHALSIGVPGLAKTLLIQTLAETMHLKFGRIQFTPDLMPSDVTGTEVLEEERATGHRAYRFIEGPVFANILLADEINRTPPKTQAALLQAMQERKVTVGGAPHVLDEPFLVLATQNPIEQHGTYPLPEAQLDRFMLAIHFDYPSLDEELEIVRRTTGLDQPQVEPVLTRAQVLRIQALARACLSPIPCCATPFAWCGRPDQKILCVRPVLGHCWPMGQVHGRRSASFWQPRPERCWMVEPPFVLRTSRPWQRPRSPIAWCRVSALRPKGWTVANWSNVSWPKCPSMRPRGQFPDNYMELR